MKVGGRCAFPGRREGSSFKRTQENPLTNRSLRGRVKVSRRHGDAGAPTRLGAHRADTMCRYTGP